MIISPLEQMGCISSAPTAPASPVAAETPPPPETNDPSADVHAGVERPPRAMEPDRDAAKTLSSIDDARRRSSNVRVHGTESTVVGEVRSAVTTRPANSEPLTEQPPARASKTKAGERKTSQACSSHEGGAHAVVKSTPVRIVR